jgi:hypothetical protein
MMSSTWWPPGPVSVLRRLLPGGAAATCGSHGRHCHFDKNDSHDSKITV